jgi:spore germination protein KA
MIRRALADDARKKPADANQSDGIPAGWTGEIPSALSESTAQLIQSFDKCSDFIIRTFEIPALNRSAAAAFIDGLVKHDMIMEAAIKPLMIYARTEDMRNVSDLETVRTNMLLSSETETLADASTAMDKLLHGDALILVDGMPGAIVMNARGWDRRSITEPLTETVVRGPREGFTETLRTNTALLRRRIASSDLRMESMQVGARSHTNICIAYMESIARPELVEEMRSRLRGICIDLPTGSGTLVDFIKDSPYSIFETVGYTEKPDVVAAKMMEGRVAVLTDGTPFVLTAPMLFVENFQTAEDYLIGSFYATFLRILRLISFFISFLAPAVYIALATFHHELIPSTLLFTMASSAEGLPFPAMIETTLMLIIFEILKEAGIRLPKPVGQAVSIVGALVMGQAAIQAGMVGAPVVIVIALTGVSSFAVPTLSNAMSLLRWYLLLCAGIMGGYGITLGLMTVMIHLASLHSFGVHHMSPFAPLLSSDFKDSIYRAPLWKLRDRPAAIGAMDDRRMQSDKPDYR